ncbi:MULTISPECIES: DUF2179 domain-containing protein [Bacillales]|uniref:UPF0316 protein R6U77_17600 n=1 Tax=Lysinibacillus louembei TaxID=1470088 RepID=A0ABZ0RTZ5_9BACI|nr:MULTISPECIES: DUF2179 domain-containing protein [Bacillales]MCT6923197.1 DUF2179 domain-containing protein [Metasolibacillus sp.]MCT6939498.1 DUF2179 domain-containing protein [Metasolibacillus sp.]WPK11683.1 DUF2179 domain-containing protein [Lysinibacillus louembei]
MNNIILIIILQLVYVPFLTLRTIFLVKNVTFLAAIFGMIEMLIYVFGLSLVFSGEQSILAMVVYAVGFGLGIFLGAKIERKLAIGYIYATINTQQKNEKLIEFLRSEGFAVTTFIGEGRDSNRYKYEILTKRNRETELFKIVEQFEPNAFIISYEPKSFKGGFLVARMKQK